MGFSPLLVSVKSLLFTLSKVEQTIIGKLILGAKEGEVRLKEWECVQVDDHRDVYSCWDWYQRQPLLAI